MTFREATDDLQFSLTRDRAGIYHLPCPKAFLKVKIRGTPLSLRFAERDKYCFRLEEEGLTIERKKTGTVYVRLKWEQIESLAAGEPETDSGLLFQG
jgi:hypothetical protein